MLKVKKDVIFCIVCILWLGSNILFSILFKDFGVFCSNVIFMVFMGIIIVFKNTNKSFSKWLETPLVNKE